MDGGQGLPGARPVAGEQSDPHLERPHTQRRPEGILAREVPVGLRHPAPRIAIAPARHGQRRERERSDPGGLVVVGPYAVANHTGRVRLQVAPILAGLELDHALAQHGCVVVVAHGGRPAPAAHQRVGVLGAADGHQAEDVRSSAWRRARLSSGRVGEAALDFVDVLLVAIDALDEAGEHQPATGPARCAHCGSSDHPAARSTNASALSRRPRPQKKASDTLGDVAERRRVAGRVGLGSGQDGLGLGEAVAGDVGRG